MAGLSVGAFAAAVVAGVLQLRDGVELVRLRAQKMEKLFPTGYGLSAIVGLSETHVAKIVQSETTQEAPVVLRKNLALVRSVTGPREKPAA